MKTKTFLLIMICTFTVFLAGCEKEISKLCQLVTKTEEYIFKSENDELPNEKIEVTLNKHIDGDTTKFNINGSEKTVRYLLIDTPETVKKNTPIEPFGIEASERTKELLEGASKLEIMFDSGVQTDKYDRLLAYVFVDDVLLQNILIQEGLAKIAYIEEPNTYYLEDLRQSENKAKADKVGLWSLDK